MENKTGHTTAAQNYKKYMAFSSVFQLARLFFA